MQERCYATRSTIDTNFKLPGAVGSQPWIKVRGCRTRRGHTTSCYRKSRFIWPADILGWRIDREGAVEWAGVLSGGEGGSTGRPSRP